ncbi:hypothetical protein [Pseudoalteromonas aurantia]|uniref:Fibronectin type-III domain-containing protein n=1 Tax=Pseudoalteromonas aurantia 208 TaxID=1314867 RepID=A0ABR9EL05_9GAMM|nr:hypothetical protein [Pseudoalteromonas aurantia]MBE0371104.1 hypothetical protein [Pseudoalteromonas aurantia 208]
MKSIAELFRVSPAIKLSVFFSILLMLVSPQSLANNVYNKVTHTLNLSSTVQINGSTTANISWSPLSEFKSVNFSFVKLAIKQGNNGWAYTDYRGNGTSIQLTQVGRWCFMLRGWDSSANQFGLFDAEQCLTVPQPPLPKTPTFSSMSSYYPINSEFTLSWSNDSAASYYQIDGKTISTNSYTTSSAHYGQKSFSVRGCNIVDVCGPYSTTRHVMVYTGPGAPRTLTANPAEAEVGKVVTLSWTEPGGSVPGIKYKVMREERVVYQGPLTYFNDAITAEGVYNYTVQAINPTGLAGGTSTLSVKAVIKEYPPKTPNITTISLGANTSYIPVNQAFEIHWEEVLGEQYEVTETFNGQTVVRGSKSPIRIAGHSQYGQYTYTIRAYNSKGSESAQQPVKIYTGPGAPKFFVATPANVEVGKSVTLSWGTPGGSVPGIKYKVTRDETIVYEGESKKFSEVISAAGTYNYHVQAINPNNLAGGTSSLSVGAAFEIKTPELRISSGGESTLYIPVSTPFNIDWTKVSGEGYTLTERHNSSDEQELGSEPVVGRVINSYGHYTYRLEAKNALGSKVSEKRVYVYTSPGAPRVSSLFMTVATGVNFSLEWHRPGGLVSGGYYKVAHNGKELYSGESTSYTPPKHDVVGTYIYKISACNPDLACTELNYKVIVKEFDLLLKIEAPDKAFLHSREEITWQFIKPQKNRFETSLSVLKPGSNKKAVVATQNNSALGKVDYTFDAPGVYRFYAQACGLAQSKVLVPVTANAILIPVLSDKPDKNVCGEIELSEVQVDVLNTEFSFENDGSKLTWSAVAGATSFEIESAVCASSCDDLSALNWTPLANLPGGQSSYNLNQSGHRLYHIKVCFSDGKCSSWIYPMEKKKSVIFIHTDLLGSPVAETKE